MKSARHILSYSGGKDSTAMYLLAMELAERHGFDFVPVFADTGGEHEATLDYVRDLPRRTGGPEIRWVKADFTQALEHRRSFVAENWPQDLIRQGLSKDAAAMRVERALAALHPSGNPFLDLCRLKGRFPSTKARFCSDELKYRPIFYQVLDPLLEAGCRVLSWQGVRANESAGRARLRRFERLGGGLWNWRPIFGWTAEQAFAMHRRHGAPPNPLYRMGLSRVGCMPCIHARKEEIWQIARRFPERIERIEAWENAVRACAKREGIGSFFAAAKTPGHDKTQPIPGIRAVVDWSATARGGRQFDLLKNADDIDRCSSVYGLCE